MIITAKGCSVWTCQCALKGYEAYTRRCVNDRVNRKQFQFASRLKRFYAHCRKRFWCVDSISFQLEQQNVYMYCSNARTTDLSTVIYSQLNLCETDQQFSEKLVLIIYSIAWTSESYMVNNVMHLTCNLCTDHFMSITCLAGLTSRR